MVHALDVYGIDPRARNFTWRRASLLLEGRQAFLRRWLLGKGRFNGELTGRLLLGNMVLRPSLFAFSFFFWPYLALLCSALLCPALLCVDC